MIDNTQDVIDSRDIIERLEELTAEEEGLIADIEEADADEEAEAKEALNSWLEENGDELDILKELNNDGSNFPDWDCGATLINEDYFEEYCEELCKDIGDIPSDLPWYIANHIDWEGVAEEIKQDYGTVEFDGQTFYIRA